MSIEKQMEMFEDGGLKDEGGSVDPVSGNDVPVGSTQEEVRDDIPAQLSEGEFVLPADVVRYHGLDKIMALRDEAKFGLQRMEAMGQMGNSEEATIPDGVPFDINDLDMEDDGVLEYNQGGVVQPQGFTGIQSMQPSVFQQYQPQYVPYQPAQPVQAGSQQYVAPLYQPPTQAVVPQMQMQQTPKLQDFISTPTGGYDELRDYRNATTGEVRKIPFVGGQPIYPIPEGFVFFDPEQVTTENVTTTPTTTQSTTVRGTDQFGDGDGSGTEAAGVGYGGGQGTGADGVVSGIPMGTILGAVASALTGIPGLSTVGGVISPAQQTGVTSIGGTDTVVSTGSFTPGATTQPGGLNVAGAARGSEIGIDPTTGSAVALGYSPGMVDPGIAQAAGYTQVGPTGLDVQGGKATHQGKTVSVPTGGSAVGNPDGSVTVSNSQGQAITTHHVDENGNPTGTTFHDTDPEVSGTQISDEAMATATATQVGPGVDFSIDTSSDVSQAEAEAAMGTEPFGGDGGGGSSGAAGDSSGSGGSSCFAAGTKFIMQDGSLKNIENIKIGDQLKLGGRVYSIIQGDGLIEDWYNYGNTKVTGNHAIYENGEWKRVKDAKNAIPALNKEEILYTLINEKHRMIAEDGVMYTDYDEVDNTGIEEDLLVELNKQDAEATAA